MGEFTKNARLMRALVHGAGLTSWRHRSRMLTAGDGSRLLDEIRTDAGWRSVFVVIFATWMSWSRRKHRRALLQE
jgi:hypothetical protein